MVRQIISREDLAPRVLTDYARFKPGTDLREMFQIVPNQGIGGTVVEITSDAFAAAFYERQRFEVNEGREEEPTLFEPIYSIVSDSTLPRNVSVNRLGPAGVVFEEVVEGGEVKFATVGQSTYSVQIKHYGVGIEYTKDLVIFNELWNLGVVERAMGRAANALLNHLHLYPIINYTYPSANLTPASSEGTGVIEHTIRTLEDAVIAGEEDTANRRPGPYVLLISPADRFKIERALTGVPQQGTQVQSSVIDGIDTIIAYNGWTGTRGHKTVTYPGVPSGTAFLISIARRIEDFQSYEKQGVEPTTGNPDVSRFILEQTVWDFYRGIYANPLAAVEKITLPTS